MTFPMTVPPADPGASYLAHKDEIDQAIARTLNKGQYILGEEVAAFEREFAGYIGVRHAIGVASGTDALHLSLRACGVGPGDVVITVSHTAVATAAAIELCGARPALVDIDPTTFTLDPNRLEDVLKQWDTGGPASVRGRLKAVVPVHLYGHPADMPAIREMAQRYGLHVVEDCAQSHGAVLKDQKTGAWGHLAAFSFYPTKNLGAFGDGGMVVTNDPMLAEQVRSLREYGWRERYVSEQPGLNSRLDELQAAILRVKLRYLDSENARRRELAGWYQDLLSASALVLPQARPDAIHVYHQYVVRTARRDSLQSWLRTHGIGTLVHYPQPVHLQPAYRGKLHGADLVPQTERAALEVLSLPMYPQLSKEQVCLVAEAVLAWARENTVER